MCARRSTLATTTAGDAGTSVRVAGINRELDQYVQRQLRVETAGGAYADLRSQFYSQLQAIYGDPELRHVRSSRRSTTSPAAVQSLVTSPDSTAARSLVLSSAQVLAQTLNSRHRQHPVAAHRRRKRPVRCRRRRQRRDAARSPISTTQLAGKTHHQRLGRGACRPARLLHRPAFAADGHPGRPATTRTRSRSSPIPASSLSARRRVASCRSIAQGTVSADDAVERRPDQKQPRHALAGVAERHVDRSDRQQVDPLRPDRRLYRHARQRAGAGAEPARRARRRRWRRRCRTPPSAARRRARARRTASTSTPRACSTAIASI